MAMTYPLQNPPRTPDGVVWDEGTGRWVTLLYGQSGASSTEVHDNLLDAVASRLRFERTVNVAGEAGDLIRALEQENRDLRKRIHYLEVNLATSSYAGWQLP